MDPDSPAYREWQAEVAKATEELKENSKGYWKAYNDALAKARSEYENIMEGLREIHRVKVEEATKRYNEKVEKA